MRPRSDDAPAERRQTDGTVELTHKPRWSKELSSYVFNIITFCAACTTHLRKHRVAASAPFHATPRIAPPRTATHMDSQNSCSCRYLASILREMHGYRAYMRTTWLCTSEARLAAILSTLGPRNRPPATRSGWNCPLTPRISLCVVQRNDKNRHAPKWIT